MKNITPSLWFDDQAEEAMNFYISVFKNSRSPRYAPLWGCRTSTERNVYDRHIRAEWPGVHGPERRP